MALGNKIPRTNWAAVTPTDRLIAFTPFSGCSHYLPDESLEIIYLEPGASEITLGRALLQALNTSRFIYPKDEPAFFKQDRVNAAYEGWHRQILRRGHYETEQEVYSNMRYCLAQRSEGKISIRPYEHDAEPRYWRNLPEQETVVIPATKNLAILGAALTLALSRCK
jgi:hypothetical protein